MQTSSARAPKPNKRKGRAVAAARPDLNIHHISNEVDTTAVLRLQRLAAFGMSQSRAYLIASLAWGAAA
ncbi:hypothetical protein SP5_070_00600 [Sphingomonas parapaucimobilis NBRC 15100]|uniref:Uncharacterized protein n=1 Tax=Sphingomonas parapaucimobilis NBRC 15100 TaxID=1219049 RepID=A0A0A1W9V4_9SPHN|nr:hypothetical protein SP5_070_00600 [Sphingomonas parapaucimobilis NBRC 15100]